MNGTDATSTPPKPPSDARTLPTVCCCARGYVPHGRSAQNGASIIWKSSAPHVGTQSTVSMNSSRLSPWNHIA
jgi:hypothetical protein